MKVAFLCPRCFQENESHIGELSYRDGDSPCATRCQSCGSELSLRISDSIRNDKMVDRCCVCENDRFYVQKDFNRKMGLAIVALGIVLSYLAFGFNLPALILGLTICLAVDFMLHRVLPDVTVCYACHAIYRGFRRNPKHGPFDLNVAEEYERR